MKKTLFFLLAFTLLLPLAHPAAAEGPQLPGESAGAEESPDWVAALGEERRAQQLFLVAGVGRTTAWVSLHERDGDGVWRQRVSTPGFIGRNGLGKTREGDGRTPVGTFTFNCAFGIAEDPGCALDYRQVTGDDYWSGDPREGFGYNRMVSLRELPELDTGACEHLIDCAPEYRYCLNISYNEEGLPGLGSAVFLHCQGPVRPFTGGCVAIPEERMLTVMQTVRPGCAVVIDSLETLSPETWAALGLEPEDPAGD